MSSRRKKTVAAVALAAIGAASYLWHAGTLGGRPEARAQATVKVVRHDFAATVLATGAVKPQIGAEVRVGARISGKVERLRANIGDTVKKGDVIAELEKADLQAIVSQRRAELQLAEAKLSSLHALRPSEIEKAQLDVVQSAASLDLASKELSRQEHLLASKFASQQDADQARERSAVLQAKRASADNAYELAQQRYAEDARQAVADVERARAALAAAEVNLSYATLTAPIAGVIGSVSTQEGETVSAGLSAPTFVTIIDLDRLQVDAFVDEVDIGKVHPGQRAVFTVDAFPSQEFEGKVVAIYPKAVIQENVVDYDAVIEITAPYKGMLRPEMTASVTVSLEARRNVLAIPVKAVRREKGKAIVLLPGTPQPRRREIKTGWKDDQWIEVTSGLQEGQTVLLQPAAPSPVEQ